MAEEEKRVPNYNPEEDDKEYIGTKLLDSIERGVGNWYQDERTLEGWEYLNPFSVATAGAIRGFEGVGWVLGNTPGASQLLQGIGWAEDRLAEGARNISGALTPDLDPRFAGWGTRLGTAILADKGIRKVAGATKATIKEGAERAAVRSGKKYTSTRPETMSNVWNDDLAGPRKTYERYSKKGYYPKNPPDDPWLKDDLLDDIKAGEAQWADPNYNDFMRGQTGLPPLRRMTDFVQGNLNIERFMSIPYLEDVRNRMSKFGMRDGTFTLKAFDSTKAKFKGNKAERRMLETYLSPDRLKGSFTGFKNAEKGTYERAWGDFLEAKGMDKIDDIQVHHINPLYDSIHLFDGVKHNSPLYWDLISTLINRNARTGTIQKGEKINNLMVTFGKAVDPKTPHGIAHKFYDDKILDFYGVKKRSEIGKSKVLADMNADPKIRIQKAEEWAELVSRSEDIILEAHEAWSSLNPQIGMSFDELIERMSKYDSLGYNKLLDPKYQVPDIANIVTEIATDPAMLPPTAIEDIPSGRIPEIVQAKKLLAEKKELLKTTKNPKQRKQLQQDIAELEREIKGPPPKQGQLPLRGYTKKPK